MLLGLVGATGVILVVTYAPPFRSARLVDRLAPYVHDTPPPSRLLGTATEAGVLVAGPRVFRPAGRGGGPAGGPGRRGPPGGGPPRPPPPGGAGPPGCPPPHGRS